MRKDELRMEIVDTILLLLLGILLACSCGVQKPSIVVKDSVRVEIHERIVHDTAYFAIAPSEQSVVSRDTTSHLENEYAETDAAIRGGLLFHSLVTHPKTIQVPVTTIVHDTLKIEAKENTIYVDVPRQASKWENFLEVCGYILLGLVFLFFAFVVIKMFIR